MSDGPSRWQRFLCWLGWHDTELVAPTYPPIMRCLRCDWVGSPEL